jgi:integrase
MLQLEWDRVDFGQRLVYLEPDDQKSGIPESIPLNEIAVRVLRKRQLLRLSGKTENAKKSPWVFADPTGERIASIKNSFYYAAAEVGLHDISPQTLRHTFGAWLVQAGVPLRTVCELCRHKDIRTTMRYAHLAPENAREAIKVLDRMSENGQSNDFQEANKIS